METSKNHATKKQVKAQMYKTKSQIRSLAEFKTLSLYSKLIKEKNKKVVPSIKKLNLKQAWDSGDRLMNSIRFRRTYDEQETEVEYPNT